METKEKGQMRSRNLIVLALTSACAVALASPSVSSAASKKNVKCEITTSGKTEVKHVASADECTKMGGKVAAKKHHKM